MTWFLHYVCGVRTQSSQCQSRCAPQYHISRPELTIIAISDNMLAALGMNTNDFKYGTSSAFTRPLTDTSLATGRPSSWCPAAELPSGLIPKKIRPDRWISVIIFAWSVASASQAGLTNKTGYYVIRCLLGLLMGGSIPDIVLYVSYWYKKKELPIRLSWFWTVLSTCNIVESLMAAGILLRCIAG